MTSHEIAPDTPFWDGIAEQYAAQPVEDPDAFERKIAIHRGLLGPDAAALEVGCGTGSLALRLAPSAGHVHGLDVSPEMIRFARAKAAEAGVANVTFHVGAFDETLTTFAPRSLDVVSAYSVLHLVANRPAALRQIFDLVKPGGAFVASTLCLGESWMPFAPLLWTMRQFGKAPHVWVFDKETLLAEIREAGFVDLETPDVGAKDTVLYTVARRPR